MACTHRVPGTCGTTCTHAAGPRRALLQRALRRRQLLRRVAVAAQHGHLVLLLQRGLRVKVVPVRVNCLARACACSG